MISVVVPTYNEAGNVRELMERLEEALSAANRQFEVVVVDDDSPDGTADVARRAGRALDLEVRVIVRTSDPDLSRSVVRGFREARGDVIVVMDADLQHPPEIVPCLAAKVSQATPIAIGTRYDCGGRIENWPLSRRIVSYGALALAKLFVPPARRVSDPISGFFAVRADVVDPDELSPDGYKILIELLAVVDPERVSEVGFVFESREHGETSLVLEQYRRFLGHVIARGYSYRRSRERR